MAGEERSSGRTTGLGAGGPNPLFFGVVFAVIVGLVGGILSTGSKTLLSSNLVFRVVVGAILFLVAYGVVAALWFAWHRRTFKGLKAGGVGVEAPDQALDDETSARDTEVAEFMATTTKAIEELATRLRNLE